MIKNYLKVALNAGIILFTGVLILVYLVGHLLGFDLKETAVDALLYKNWFWWGLDLIAEANNAPAGCFSHPSGV
ncbi:unnamed protein product [marine sediment metagenome]|uniref:Uncharacterized protein n=1 Tax=marine sediment metagenome TaxID=412755 RepID=X1T3Q8_9ZZZZ